MVPFRCRDRAPDRDLYVDVDGEDPTTEQEQDLTSALLSEMGLCFIAASDFFECMSPEEELAASRRWAVSQMSHKDQVGEEVGNAEE